MALFDQKIIYDAVNSEASKSQESECPCVGRIDGYSELVRVRSHIAYRVFSIWSHLVHSLASGLRAFLSCSHCSAIFIR